VTSDHLGVIASTVEDAWHVCHRFRSGSAARPSVSSRCRPEPASISTAAEAVPACIRAAGREIDNETRNAFDTTLDHLRRTASRSRAATMTQCYADLKSSSRAASRRARYHRVRVQWPYGDYIARYGKLVGPRIHELVDRARGMSPADYEALLANRHRMQLIVAARLAHLRWLDHAGLVGAAPVDCRNGEPTFCVVRVMARACRPSRCRSWRSKGCPSEYN
jgi:Asp-tRNA(Asn)/Glu-tRNA(Gln) amidotransferase A subunit family amidase